MIALVCVTCRDCERPNLGTRDAIVNDPICVYCAAPLKPSDAQVQA